ncbi:MAG: carboxyl transferase domain-containing protein, partial [Bacteriovoracaceae bacterium]
MGWFNSVKNPKLKNVKRQPTNTPAGIWKKCAGCSEILQTQKLDANQNVCPFCDHHYRLDAEKRIEMLTDAKSFREFGADLETKNPLNFHDKVSYNDRLSKAYANTSKKDGTVCGYAKVDGQPVTLACMDFRFMGGSMGVVTGEKIAMAMDEGAAKNL